MAQPANADSLSLRNGHQVQGKFLGGTQGVIAFSVSGATQYYNVSDVLGMTFEEEVTSQSNDDTQQPSIVPQNSPAVTIPQSQKHGPRLETKPQNIPSYVPSDLLLFSQAEADSTLTMLLRTA